jgi:hypothetical protein
MDSHPFFEATCFICRAVTKGRFRDRWNYCALHKRDEIDFLQSLPDGKLTTEQKQLRMIYRRRWDKHPKEAPCQSK